MAGKKRNTERRLTEDESDRIVELCLNRVPVRRIADEIGCSKNTVSAHWHRWLDETAVERREQLERHRSEQIARLDSAAALARQGAVRARVASGMDPADRARAEARFLAEERQAIRALCTIAGFDAPIRIAASFDTMTDDEAQAILDRLP